MADLVLGVVAVVAVSLALLCAEGRAQARCDDRVRILLERNPTRWWYPADLVDAGAGSLGYVCAAIGRLADHGLVERHSRHWSYRWRADAELRAALSASPMPPRSRIPTMGRLIRAGG